MPVVICDDCETELVTATLEEPANHGGVIRRKRTYCPECGPPGNASVVSDDTTPLGGD